MSSRTCFGIFKMLKQVQHDSGLDESVPWLLHKVTLVYNSLINSQ
jgi:hypothetical protein